MPLTSKPAPLAGDEAALHAKNYDAKCLRCGVMNIPENRICGSCGASLPLNYDRDGNFMMGPHDPDLSLRLKHGPGPRTISPGRVSWFLRFGIIFFAVAVAYVLMHRK